MTPREEELFGILQEEAAEIIKVVSKRRRFGSNERNVSEFVQEMGDFLAVVHLLMQEGYFVVSDEQMQTAIDKKLAKLKVYMVHKPNYYPPPAPVSDTKG